jgi:hypothetical protein
MLGSDLSQGRGELLAKAEEMLQIIVLIVSLKDVHQTELAAFFSDYDQPHGIFVHYLTGWIIQADPHQASIITV